MDQLELVLALALSPAPLLHPFVCIHPCCILPQDNALHILLGFLSSHRCSWAFAFAPFFKNKFHLFSARFPFSSNTEKCANRFYVSVTASWFYRVMFYSPSSVVHIDLHHRNSTGCKRHVYYEKRS